MPSGHGIPRAGEHQRTTSAPERPAANPAASAGSYGTFEFRTEKWEAAYIKRVDATIAAMKSAGVPVFWVGLPPQRGFLVAAGLDALLVTPGPDLRWLTGYDALPLERLTCLVVPATGDAFLVAPGLEVPAVLASPVRDLDIEVVGWGETDDPYALVAPGQSIITLAAGGVGREPRRGHESARG